MGVGRDLIFTILGIDKSGSDTLNKVGKAADHAANRLDNVGRVSIAALGGTVAASAAAGVGIAAALGGTALAFGALGLAAASSNQQVQDSYSDLWHGIQAGTKAAAEPLQSTLLGISHELGDAFADLQPELRGLFTESVPSIHALVDGVIGFANEAMPGLQKAVASAAVPMQGLRDAMISSGKGVTDFFTNLSGGSESSGRILRDLGEIIRSALGFAGNLFARLANEGAPTVHRLGQVFSQLLGVVDRLAAGALPVLFSAAGAGLNVLSGLLTVVGGLANQLGPLTGIAIASAAALKLIDMVSFGQVTGQLRNLRAAVGEAEGIGGKLKAGLAGLAVGFGPLGFAAAGVGVILHELGQKQAAAAQKAAEHKAHVDSLTKSLVESRNVVTSQIAQDQIRLGQQKGLFEVAKQIGVEQSVMTRALLGNRDAINEVNAAWDRQPPTLDRVGNTANTISDKFNLFGGSVVKYASNARGEFGLLSGAMIESQDAAQGIIDKQQGAAYATDQHAAAALRLHNLLLGFVDKNLGYRMAINAEKEAHEKATETIKKKGAASDEARAATFAWEQSITGLVVRSAELAESQYRGSDATELARLKMQAQNQEILRLAQAAGSTAPPALRQLLAGMDGATMAALGMKVSVDKAGNSVITLPNGKTITLTAEDKATPVVLGVKNELNLLRDKVVRLTVLRTGDIQSTGGGRIFERAEGGPISKGVPYWVGERGPELIFPDRDGFVATAAQSRTITSGSGPGGGAVGAGAVRVVLDVTGADADLVRLFRRAVKVEAGGSAERFFRS